MGRICAAIAVALALPAIALSATTPHTVKPDRGAINALLDQFVPDVVIGRDLKAGWNLAGGYARAVSYRDWLRGDTPVQHYPAKGTSFHGWTLNYSYPNDIGFDILLQSSKKTVGPWSFRAEAQKSGGRWRITTWYVVAQFAPRGQDARVLGPNDFGPSNGPHMSQLKSRVPSWALLIPLSALGALGILGGSVAGVRWWRRRSRIRAIERDLAT
jgi:hypothetical protein